MLGEADHGEALTFPGPPPRRNRGTALSRERARGRRVVRPGYASTVKYSFEPPAIRSRVRSIISCARGWANIAA